MLAGHPRRRCYCGPPRIDAGGPGNLKRWPVSLTLSPSTPQHREIGIDEIADIEAR
jgi:hypothetical protein